MMPVGKRLFGMFGPMVLLAIAYAMTCLLAVADNGAVAPTPVQPVEEITQPAQPQTSIMDEFAAFNAAREQQDFKTVWERSRAILKAAEARVGEPLSGREHFAVGLAHHYLVAEAFDQALRGGNLMPEEAEFAQSMREHIMARPPDLLVVGQGQPINLEDHLAEGKTTIVDFYSEYCGPCVRIAPQLEALATQRQDIRVLKVDINRPGIRGIDWQSPVAQQFGLRSIPHFNIFGPDKQLIAEGDAAWALVRQWLGSMP